jgi:hypothetical protein
MIPTQRKKRSPRRRREKGRRRRYGKTPGHHVAPISS